MYHVIGKKIRVFPTIMYHVMARREECFQLSYIVLWGKHKSVSSYHVSCHGKKIRVLMFPTIIYRVMGKR